MTLCEPISRLSIPWSSPLASSSSIAMSADHWSRAKVTPLACTHFLTPDRLYILLRTQHRPYLLWNHCQTPPGKQAGSHSKTPQTPSDWPPPASHLCDTAAHAIFSTSHQHVAHTHFPKTQRKQGSQPPPSLKPRSASSSPSLTSRRTKFNHGKTQVVAAFALISRKKCTGFRSSSCLSSLRLVSAGHPSPVSRFVVSVSSPNAP